MSLRCKVLVRIRLTGGEAAAIREALEPDNVRMPEGLDVDVRDDSARDVLILEFSDAGKDGINHLVGTIDEVLEHVQVALGAIRRC